MKTSKQLIIFWCGGIVLFLGSILYYISQFTAVYSPLKKYRLANDISQLKKSILLLAESDSTIRYSYDDSTGNKLNGIDHYLTITINRAGQNKEFHVKYFISKNLWGKPQKSELNLIGAFNLNPKTGGYKIDDDGIYLLLQDFENEYLNKLKSIKRLD